MLSLFSIEMAFTVSFGAQVMKLVDLHKESSEEWSRKAGELEGVIKALEVRSCFYMTIVTLLYWFLDSGSKHTCSISISPTN
jgi:hypothetical protein